MRRSRGGIGLAERLGWAGTAPDARDRWSAVKTERLAPGIDAAPLEKRESPDAHHRLHHREPEGRRRQDHDRGQPRGGPRGKEDTHAPHRPGPPGERHELARYRETR